MNERAADPPPSGGFDLVAASQATTEDLFRMLSTRQSGLTQEEVANRRLRFGANALRHHRAQALVVLLHQFQSPLLVLLAVTAVASYFLGEHESAIIILIILCLSIGLGFINEYRAERAAQELHDQIRHHAYVRRESVLSAVDVSELVPGDIVELHLGQVVPADVRIIQQDDLECDESIITGESVARSKQVEPLETARPLTDLPSCALMGTVVQHGHGSAVVVATGPSTAFGRIALQLSAQESQTEFQRGLSKFSLLLIRIALTLTILIFATNILLHRPLIDALLFSLAIAVGLTPQLLPAVVSISLAAGSHALRSEKVLVKRLVCIEDLGDITLLLTDKTGTLTTGSISFSHQIPAAPDSQVRWLGLASMGIFPESPDDRIPDPIDGALWDAANPAERTALLTRVAREQLLAFDHERRRSSSLCSIDGARVLIVRGAPDAVFPLCLNDTDEVARISDKEFKEGRRVIAVASKEVGPECSKVTTDDENNLVLEGLLVFEDPPRPSTKESLKRLSGLGIALRIVTGDHPDVARAVCKTLKIGVHGVLTGADIDKLDDDELLARAQRTTIFARAGPEHKARIVRLFRKQRGGVAFLGDGVNDALALHAADVGITVDTAVDIAKDASDIILLEKDLDVLANGVVRGRQIFANTMKYVLMETSSNFGNVFSAAGASAILPFLPMLPSQILLNNLLYGASQLTIPTDHVDPEQASRPTLWDVRFIRWFMLVFGPISSLFDFLTFGLMLAVFHAHASLFQSGWFIESLATQTLIILAIRTRRIPFYKSRASWPVILSAVAIATIGALLPYSPLASPFGFRPLPALFFLALLGMILCYLALVEIAKHFFFKMVTRVTTGPPTVRRRRIQRRGARFTTEHPKGLRKQALSATASSARSTKAGATRKRRPTSVGHKGPNKPPRNR